MNSSYYYKTKVIRLIHGPTDIYIYIYIYIYRERERERETERDRERGKGGQNNF